jgi:hypothetical protein
VLFRADLARVGDSRISTASVLWSRGQVARGRIAVAPARGEPDVRCQPHPVQYPPDALALDQWCGGIVDELDHLGPELLGGQGIGLLGCVVGVSGGADA